MTTELVPTKLEQLRENLPDVVGLAARLIVDNPQQMLAVACGSYVMTSALVNLVKPRGTAGFVACGIVSYGISTALTGELIRRGVLRFRVRDEEGQLVPLKANSDEPCQSTTP